MPSCAPRGSARPGRRPGSGARPCRWSPGLLLLLLGHDPLPAQRDRLALDRDPGRPVVAPPVALAGLDLEISLGTSSTSVTAVLRGGKHKKSSSARDELFTRGATLVGQIHCPSHSRARPDAEAMPLPDNGGFRLGLLGAAARHYSCVRVGRLACDSGAHSPHSSREACTIPHSLWEGSAATIFP